MAEYDDIQKLILQVVGEQEVKELTERLNEQKQALLGIQKQFEAGQMDMPAYGQALRRQAEAIQETTNQLKVLDQQMDVAEEKGLGFKMRGGMRADLVLAHAFRELANDTASLTDKMEALARSVPYALSLFGVGGPWLMGLTMAGTAILEIGTHWNDLMAFLGNKAPKEAADAIEDMAKRANVAIKAFREAVEKPTEFEEESGKLLAKLVAGPQGRKIQDQIIAAMQAGGTAPPMPAQDWANLVAAANERRQGLPITGTRARQLEDIEERRKKQLMEEAERILSNLQEGKTRQEREEALTRLRGLAEQKPEMFIPKLAERLAEMTPEALKAQDIEGRQAELDAEEFGERAKRGVQARHAIDRQNKRLTDQGYRGEDEARKIVEKQEKDEERQRDKMAKAREKHAHEQFQARTPSAGRLRELDEEQLIREAMLRQLRAQQQGGFRPGEMQRLQRLAERLGKDFPTWEKMLAMEAQAQSGLVSNQVSLHQRLKMIEETQRRIKRVGTDSHRQQQRNLNGGGAQ